MEEKLNHLMIQTKSYTESVQNTPQEKNQTPNGAMIDFGAIMEETNNAELVEKKERNSVPRTLLSTVLKNLVKTRMMLLNLTISI